jgi:5-methylcytosine-specific restriction protein A
MPRSSERRDKPKPTNWAAYRDNRSAHQRGYGKSWRALRLQVLTEEPLCRACNERELYVSATTVDHIVNKRNGGSDDRANLQPLCDACHKAKTATENTAPAPRIVVTGEPGSGKSTWVKERAKPGDLVWDLDDIASVMGFHGQPLRRDVKGQLPWAVMKATLVMRDALMRWLSFTKTHGAAVYVIVTDRADANHVATQIGADVHVAGEPKGERQT